MNITSKRLILLALASAASAAFARPVPPPAVLSRLADGIEVIGIVHWGLNTFTDREWGFGDEDPKLLNPSGFDADQIAGACKAGGLGGLVIVAKHHDGFCLWPTKTTEHNITKSPFRGGKGDYVREMADACRRAGLRVGIYVSPWDRNNADYATPKYVETFRAQLKEVLGGAYGDIFHLWFDGAMGGSGYYGGKREARKVGNGYYRYAGPDGTYALARRLQPNVCIFQSEEDGSDFRWPGNESGAIDPNSRATICRTGGFDYTTFRYLNPEHAGHRNTGCLNGEFFRMCEADFPLRKGWFYHPGEAGTTKSGLYLLNRYLTTVGNGAIMEIGVAPDRTGVLVQEDVKALREFKALKDAFFANEVKAGSGKPFNVVVLREDISKGELVDGWTFSAGGKKLLSGTAISNKRIRTLDAPVPASDLSVDVTGPFAKDAKVSFKLYYADPEFVKAVRTAKTNSGETDTAKWMTGVEQEKR